MNAHTLVFQAVPARAVTESRIAAAQISAEFWPIQEYPG